jgi:hypothetical protein
MALSRHSLLLNIIPISTFLTALALTPYLSSSSSYFYNQYATAAASSSSSFIITSTSKRQHE